MVAYCYTGVEFFGCVHEGLFEAGFIPSFTLALAYYL